ncbi:MAG: DUF2786 domain-containing protein [Bdellovibrionaceae bacterium]|jgi:hypothetical protein|nr:DUF2786 domain-containing protein [Pseudobdellovibrionaceae bacterium]
MKFYKFKKSKEKLSPHTAWGLQLIFEHQQICYQQNIKLPTPSFQISLGQSFWARWNPQLRLIEVSEKLILQHSWDIVVQVLKHEMAHQYVTECFKVDDGHGSYFKHACEVLSVVKAFQTSSGALPEQLEIHVKSPLTELQRKFLSKTEKLLSLAQSDNENEAALAMQKVQELYLKYNIADNEQHQYKYHIIHFNKKRVAGIQSLIASILTDYYFVKCVFSEKYDPSKQDSFKTLEILGKNENVEIANYVYYFLNERCLSFWKIYQKKHSLNASQKNSYQLGLLYGFSKKLKAQKEDILKKYVDHAHFSSTIPHSSQSSHLKKSIQAGGTTKKPKEKIDSSAKQLIHIYTQLQTLDRQLGDYVSHRFPKIKWSGRSKSSINPQSYNTGLSDGAKININKGLQQKGNSSQLKFITS